MITSNTDLAAARGNVLIKKRESGLSRDSVVNVSQVFTIAKAQLRDRVKKLDVTRMQEVAEGIRLVLGLKQVS